MLSAMLHVTMTGALCPVGSSFRLYSDRMGSLGEALIASRQCLHFPLCMPSVNIVSIQSALLQSPIPKFELLCAC